MKNKRQLIFLLAGTVVFSIIIYTLAKQDYYRKKIRMAFQINTTNETKIYSQPNTKSSVLGSLPKNTTFTVFYKNQHFYRLAEKENQPPYNKGYLLQKDVKVTDTLLLQP